MATDGRDDRDMGRKGVVWNHPGVEDLLLDGWVKKGSCNDCISSFGSSALLAVEAVGRLAEALPKDSDDAAACSKVGCLVDQTHRHKAAKH